MSAFITGLDMQVLQQLFSYRDITTTISFITISELGSTIFVCGIMLCTALLLVYWRKVPLAIGLAVSVLGGGAAALALKELIHRARPDLIYQAYHETGFSFPSGHSTLAAACYGFLIYLTWCMLPASNKRTAIVTGLTILIALIAFSRLYLGVHYLSDVVGGLLLGVLFVWIGSVLAKRLERRN